MRATSWICAIALALCTLSADASSRKLLQAPVGAPTDTEQMATEDPTTLPAALPDPTAAVDPTAAAVPLDTNGDDDADIEPDPDADAGAMAADPTTVADMPETEEEGALHDGLADLVGAAADMDEDASTDDDDADGASATTGLFGGKLKGIGTDAQTTVQDAQTAVTDQIGTAQTNVQQRLGTAQTDARDRLSSAGEGIQTQINDLQEQLNGLTGKLSGLFQGGGEGLGGLLGGLTGSSTENGSSDESA